MNRLALLWVAGLACSAMLAGCGGAADVAPEPTAPEAPVVSTVPLDGYDAMAADGAGEVAAAQTAAHALEGAAEGLSSEQRAALKADQRLIAYLVRVELESQVAFFEVRADGIAHNIYSYPRAFDSGSIIWVPAENAQTMGAVAKSEGELRSVAAVTEVMRDAFPDGGLMVTLGGYRFAFLAEGTDPVHIEIAADGATVISVSR